MYRRQRILFLCVQGSGEVQTAAVCTSGTVLEQDTITAAFFSGKIKIVSVQCVIMVTAAHFAIMRLMMPCVGRRFSAEMKHLLLVWPTA
jgi:hypothetical protein